MEENEYYEGVVYCGERVKIILDMNFSYKKNVSGVCAR